MTLLKGLNYDIAIQQKTQLTRPVEADQTEMRVLNTEGLVTDDYMIVEPFTENSEIVKISTINTNNKITLSAVTKFTHPANSKLVRTQYNQIKFYSATESAGTYTVIAGMPIEMTYVETHTNFDYTAGTSALFYKRTFVNESSSDESEIALADEFQISDEDTYITTEQMRVFMQFDKNDFPNPNDMLELIKITEIKVNLDVSTSNPNILKYSTLLLGRWHILKALANKAVSKGYIQIEAEGRTITKAHQELLKDAKEAKADYMDFINENTRTEVKKTNFLKDTTLIDSETRSQIIDIFTGTQDGIDFERNGLHSYGGRQFR